MISMANAMQTDILFECSLHVWPMQLLCELNVCLWVGVGVKGAKDHHTTVCGWAWCVLELTGTTTKGPLHILK